MATVTGLTKDRMLAIEAASVVGGQIDDAGHLILTKHDGSTIDAGPLFASIPNATTTVPGVVALATNAEVSTGTDATKAVTPASLESILGPISDTIENSLQPLDTDLTAIAALTAADDDILQRKTGAWTNRTIIQLLADLVVAGAQTNEVYNGTTYGLAGGAITYIGDTDPGGSAADGSVWFDTSGA